MTLHPALHPTLHPTVLAQSEYKVAQSRSAAAEGCGSRLRKRQAAEAMLVAALVLRQLQRR